MIYYIKRELNVNFIISNIYKKEKKKKKLIQIPKQQKILPMHLLVNLKLETNIHTMQAKLKKMVMNKSQPFLNKQQIMKKNMLNYGSKH